MTAPAAASGLEAGHGPNSPQSLSAPTATSSVTGSTASRASFSPSESTSSSTQTSPYHTHRQNHNSSKLPAFRFADLHNKQQSLSLPSPQQHHSAVQSPASPRSPPRQSQSIVDDAGRDPNPPLQKHLGGDGSASDSGHHHQNSPPLGDSPRQHAIGSSPPRLTTHQAQPLHHHHNEQQSHPRDRHDHPSLTPRDSNDDDDDSAARSRANPRSRASTFQATASTTPSTTTSNARPASFPDSPAGPRPPATTTNETSARTQYRRAPASRGSNGTESASDAPILTSRRQDSIESTGDNPTKEWAQGQRELLLPKSVQTTTSTDEKRQTTRSRPPLSFRKPSNTTSGSVRVAPIRSFRSSGSRRSFGLDMNSSPILAGDSSGDDYSHTDSNHRDRTLQALEGRSDDEILQMASRHDALDGDDTTGDVFMKIARQEAPRTTGGVDGNAIADHGNAISRVTRSSHRRPLSTNLPSTYQPTSPQRPRRLSDQQDTASVRSRSRQVDDDASTDIISRVPYRGLREKAASSHPAEDSRLSRAPVAGHRPSPITPRSYAFQDSSAENSAYARRRTSITESNAGYSGRNPAYRHSSLIHGPSRTFNSSPLAPRTAEPLRHDYHHLEGTESTASTTAPSTVWDELDDLKSRIHRLELTGKLPSTSSAAMHKALDERPPTATNTTVSTSPKQTTGNALVSLNDASSTTSSQKEAQPLLVSALNQSKTLLSEEVSKALEAAASDAVSLLAMMGTAGQPGPISSGASTIGAGGTLTDRQLRRRAEGICRSLTELVIALSDEAGQPPAAKPVVVQTNIPRTEAPTTPTLTKAFPSLSGQTHQRRNSITSEQIERPDSIPSPRAMSKLEERRNTMLNASALPAPRLTQVPGTPVASVAGSAAGRKSSLLISRTRRAVTEEPEEGRRSSMMLRTRRAGTEEPEEGRTTTLLRDRKANIMAENDDLQFRPPSRAATDLNSPRSVSHQYPSSFQQQDNSSTASSGLPRRRVGSSMLGSSRLASPSTFSGRRFLERSTPERDGNSFADKLAEDRGQRQVSQTPSLLSRTTSLLRRPNRDSTITNSSTSAQAGGYR